MADSHTKAYRTELTSITCVDCGAAYKTTRANTRRCERCRFRNGKMYLIAHGKAIRKCAACEEEFAPISTHDRICDGCEPFRRKAEVKGECRFCKKTVKLWHRDIPVCRTCLKDPATQPKLMKAVKKGYEERVAQSGWDDDKRAAAEAAAEARMDAIAAQRSRDARI